MRLTGLSVSVVDAGPHIASAAFVALSFDIAAVDVT
jgi:hypothetical protein